MKKYINDWLFAHVDPKVGAFLMILVTWVGATFLVALAAKWTFSLVALPFLAKPYTVIFTLFTFRHVIYQWRML